jgi:regulator of sirC expression with transglutaminase-like and TPR domain
MARIAKAEFKEPLSEKQRAALLTLLADEDPAVYRTVRQKILRMGPPATEWLRPCMISLDPALRRRTQEIVLHFEKQAADNRFLAFCLRHGEDFDLEQGAWLLAQSEYPEISVDGYRALLDNYAAAIRERLHQRACAQEVLGIMNELLFIELGFAGNEADFCDPQNSYLNRVLDRRSGNPISLCLIYVLLARRLALPITGIGLPGRFICRYQTSAEEVYIDAFAGGTLLTKADCVHYLLNTSFSVRDDYLSPVTPRRFLLRVCANLHQIYLQNGRDLRTTRMQRYIVALAR